MNRQKYLKRVLCGILLVTEFPYTPIHAETPSTSSVPINLTVPATPVNVTIPSALETKFEGTDVDAIVPTNLSIINNSNVGNLKLIKVAATLKDDSWTLNQVSDPDTYRSLPLDSKQIYLGISKNGGTMKAITKEGIDPGIWIKPSSVSGNEEPFHIELRTGGTSKTIDTELVSLEFTFQYERAGEAPGLYNDEGIMTASWDELVESGDIRLYDTVLFDAQSENLNGELIIDNGITSIAPMAFQGNKSIKKVTIPYGITSIDDSTFSECPSLYSVVIPETVTSIGNLAFEYCDSLTEVSPLTNVKSVGNHAFDSDTKLKSIDMPGVVTIGEGAFFGSGLVEVTHSDNLTSIGDSAFQANFDLVSLTLPNSVTSIGAYAFEDCTKLNPITIPTSIVSVGEKAFNLVPEIRINHRMSESLLAGAPWGALNRICSDQSFCYKPGGSNNNDDTPPSIEIPIS